MAPLLRFDAYAFVTAAGVAGLGFMLTYHFKRDLSEWEWGDWGYALAAAVYVYFRNVGRHEMTEVVGASSEASREEHPEDSGTAANVKKIKGEIHATTLVATHLSAHIRPYHFFSRTFDRVDGHGGARRDWQGVYYCFIFLGKCLLAQEQRSEKLCGLHGC
jgi:hypothetical protein